ncbi:MAG: DUF3750 domain-containing protein, partial [Planctomycetes bacterium]|nr:DUF3750 domain-containing protein [Planctomycetota bacterium]
AEHSWFDLRRGSDDEWWRVEVLGPTSGVIQTRIDAAEAREDVRWERRVFVLATWHGDVAHRACERILELAAEHPDFGRLEFIKNGETSWTANRIPAQREEYAAWPGPNSNTFVVDLVRQTDGLALELDHNAVGKNYARGFRLGRTLDGLGFEVDTDYLGVGLGLRQGFEFRLLGLTFGVGFWPPAIKIPIVPRIGVQPGWVSTEF